MLKQTTEELVTGMSRSLGLLGAREKLQSAEAHQFALARWIYAALIAINGGAILGLSQFPNTMAGILWAFPIFWFVSGIALAIISAKFAEMAAAASARQHWLTLVKITKTDQLRVQLLGDFITASSRATIDKSIDDLSSEMDETILRNRGRVNVSNVLGTLSLCSFAAGCMVLAWYLPG